MSRSTHVLHLVPADLTRTEHGEGIDMGNVWASHAERWVISRVRRREIVPGTARNNRSALSSFTASLGNRTVIRPSDIERWIASRSDRTDATIRSQLGAIRGWCRWLTDQKLLPADPMVGIHGPKEPRRLPRYMAADDVATVLAASPDARMTAILWLMFGAGLRCCEVSRLRVENWDRTGGTMTVRGKGDHEREVPVVDQVRVALTDYLAQYPLSHGPLIRSYRTPMAPLASDTISGYVSDLMIEAGVKRASRDGVSAHALRHTAASDTLEASGGNLWLVAELLGHRNLATTQIYLRRARSVEMRVAMEGRRYAA